MACMKRIGLLGGMSWESTAEYYRFVNEAVRERLGGLHSADCIMRSVDFADIETLQREGRWEEAGAALADEARALEAAGAELLVLCTNTMHRVAGEVAAAVGVPFIHIADATAAAVRSHGLSRVGLLATAYTMEQDFYVGRLRDLHGLEVLVPDARERRIVHDVIYGELCVGVIRDDSRDAVPAHHGRARGARRRGDPPRVHGDRAARRPGRQRTAVVRHHPAPRRGCRGAGPGGACQRCWTRLSATT